MGSGTRRLTREQVLAMKAGAEMDGLVRERVLRLPAAKTVGDSLSCYSLFPSYAVDVMLAASLAVVFSEDGVYAGRPEDIEHGYVRGTAVPTLTLHMPENGRWIAAPSFALAVCRAALLLTLDPVDAGGAS
jgi:hypothetical protein